MPTLKGSNTVNVVGAGSGSSILLGFGKTSLLGDCAAKAPDLQGNTDGLVWTRLAERNLIFRSGPCTPALDLRGWTGT
jgi:hypothetical protein